MSKQTITIGSQLVGDNQECYLIGEIGINHNGDVEIAKQLIDQDDPVFDRNRREQQFH